MEFNPGVNAHKERISRGWDWACTVAPPPPLPESGVGRGWIIP